MSERIEITRIEFEQQWGLKPDPDTIGTCFYSDSGTLLREYVFVDEGPTVAWLEKLYHTESKP
jgi:hypothetical protein